MKEEETAQMFLQFLDQVMEDLEEVPSELGEMMTIAAWLTELGGSPGHRFRRRLKTDLRQQWQAQYCAKAGPQKGTSVRSRPLALLANLGSTGRILLASVVVTVWAVVFIFAASPQARGTVLRSLQDAKIIRLDRVRVDQTRPYWATERPPCDARWYATIAEAQEHADIAIREPNYLPSGFRLEGVTLRGPVEVTIGYRREDMGQGVDLLYLSMLSLLERDDIYSTYPGELECVDLEGHPAAWGSTGPRQNTLQWEDGPTLFSLYSTLPREAMQRTAISMFTQ